MTNGDIASAFARIADLLEITGADRFRVNSYRRAYRTVKEATEDLPALAADGKLPKLPGIGSSIAGKITQFVTEGRIDLLDELAAKLPEGLPKLLEVPSLGPKKIALLYHEIGIGSIEDLTQAIADGAVERLRGFGSASVKRITEGIAFLATASGRVQLGLALPIASELADKVAELPNVARVEVAGSLRRGMETVGDVDLLCQSESGQAVVEAFTKLPGVRRVLGAGATKGSVTVALPGERELRVQLRVVPAESYGAALQYFTGSKEHNVRLRELAVKRKWKLNEWGLFDGDERLAGVEERDIYEALGLPHLPPEVREDRDEFADGFDPGKLIKLDDIRGDLHMHTLASDGKSTIEEMARAAMERGYEYIAICDHSKSSAIANGLSIERMRDHIQAIRSVNERLDGITVLAGCECDILADGSMDYPDALLAECDWVVASIHSALSGGKVSPTERTLAAMANRYVCAIGHPTGRLINRRAPMDIDIDRIVRAAVETHTALEINSSWQRLDLKDTHIRQALNAGAMLTVNTDAHSADGLAAIAYGITTARRAAVTPDRVVNTMPVDALRAWINRKRATES